MCTNNTNQSKKTPGIVYAGSLSNCLGLLGLELNRAITVLVTHVLFIL